MKTDILIAGLMVAFSIAALFGVILTVARATREEPRAKAKQPAAQPQPALRLQQGW